MNHLLNLLFFIEVPDAQKHVRQVLQVHLARKAPKEILVLLEVRDETESTAMDPNLDGAIWKHN